jgi:anti-sigma regulatory factor (Ser/Thr protein kinase)
VSISSSDTTNAWWRQLRSRLTILYLCFALALLAISAAGHVRLLHEVGKTFGGFFWAIADQEVVFVSTPPQLPPQYMPSLTSDAYITAANQRPGSAGITYTYQHALPGTPITYTFTYTFFGAGSHLSFIRPATEFTFDMWWQSYGLPLLAGISWLIVGALLLTTASDWNGAVEGLTLLPGAMLLLLYSHWGNVQQAYEPDIVVQLLWTPAFALLGAAFIHLSLIYRPQTLLSDRRPDLVVDGLPYLPLIALVAYEWSSFLILKHVPMRLNLLASLGYGFIGAFVSIQIGLRSLGMVWFPKLFRRSRAGTVANPIPARIRRRIVDMLALWIIAGLALWGLVAFPILLGGEPFLPLPVLYILAAIYPLILLYAIRKLRLLDRLQVALEQREELLSEQHRRMEDLQQTSRELQRATSILLRADACLRSTLSQRIHDQPKQQALRIRSLLGHWQHKLRVEAERDPEGKVTVQPIIEALGKVRKISEELEDDLGGLQLLIEDAYQRRSLGLKLHLEKLVREDLPALHPESPLKVRADLWALDALNPDLEETTEGARIAEAISYTVTQALLNIYNHAGATFATVRTLYSSGVLEVLIIDDGRGFDPDTISPEKTSLFKAQLKAREAGGAMTIESSPRQQGGHGTTITLRLPIPPSERRAVSHPQAEKEPETQGIKEGQDIQSRL